jgi:23S rRNA (uracil1939-C5)-methyltransferase
MPHTEETPSGSDAPSAPPEESPVEASPAETVAGPPRSNKRARRLKRRRRARGELPPPFEVTLDGFAAGGTAVGRAPDGRVVFVEYALPGERVTAEVTGESPSYLEARAIEVHEASPARVEPPCPYFGRCGGCQLQHIDYPEQLVLKTELVREQLRRIGHFEDPPVATALGMANPWAYRNHMRFTVRRDGDVGFMERGTHRFLRVDRCLIAHDQVNTVLKRTQDSTTGTRQLSVRVGAGTGEVLIQPRLSWRARKRPIASGQKHYHDELGGRRFRVSAAAFFQVNREQAERLARLVRERVVEAQPRVVVDAYAGVGTFAALLAGGGPWRVITIEESAAAGNDAEVNLADLPEVTRLVGSVEALLPDLDPEPELVIVDPPRVGLAPSVIEALLASACRRLVYVSCDPATLSRDLRLLVDGDPDAGRLGFTLASVQPLDMFPQTQHVECVATLDRIPSEAGVLNAPTSEAAAPDGSVPTA